MQSGYGRASGGLWRGHFGGRKLGEWRRRVSWPLLVACALVALQRFVPALPIDDWLRSVGSWLAIPAELVPRPEPAIAESEATLENAWNGVAAARARLRAAEEDATAPRGRIAMDSQAPGVGLEPPPSRFVEVLAKPDHDQRWQLGARIASSREGSGLDPRGAIALWRQMVVGRVARDSAPDAPLELVLSIEKGQRFPVVYRGESDAIGSGVLVAGPFATPSGEDAAFRLLHPTCDPLSADEPLRLSAGPPQYRKSIRAFAKDGELAEEARQLSVGAGFVVARFRDLRSFADGWYADAVFDPSFVHGVHLAGVATDACIDLPACEPLEAHVRDASDIDAGTRSAGLDLGTSAGLERGDAVLARGLLIGEVAALCPRISRVRSLDDEGALLEALLLTPGGELRHLGRLRSRGRVGDAWTLIPEQALPAELEGELFAGASARAGWKGLPLGSASVSADGLELSVSPRAWSSGDALAVLAGGRR
ncbi:MAG: hypothetical protein IPN34_25505 [Planctomycetes bacterium]|nr:hypothetical protein [Planctomycetota bacterium]